MRAGGDGRGAWTQLAVPAAFPAGKMLMLSRSCAHAKRVSGDNPACPGIHRVTGAWLCVPRLDLVEIDPDSDIPRYEQLAAILRGQIEDGTIRQRRPLPSKKVLMQQLGVSAGTVERALNVLRDAGMIRTVKGLGLYVTPRGDWKN